MIEGDLRNVPLTDVLQIIATGQKSGVLSVEWDEARARVHAERGLVLAARVTGAPPLGELLVRLDLLTAREVQELLDAQADDPFPLPLGMAAVRAGHLTKVELRSALRRQAVEVLAELLTWRAGSFTFTERSANHTAVPTEGGHDAMALLMEADALRRELDEGTADPGAVFRRAGDPATMDLPENAWEVLSLVDGHRPARLVAAESDLGEDRGLRLLAKLQELGAIEPVHEALPDTAALVSCDDPTVARLLRLSLHRIGIRAEPLTAEDPLLERLDAVRPSVLLIDERDGAGWELLRRVRSLPGRGHLPALVLTDGSPAGPLARWRRPKAETMSRPFDEFELQRVVARLTGRSLP